MKNRLLSILMLIGTSSCFAQSSVTVYGRIDNGFQYVGGSGIPSGHVISAESGDFGGSHFGMQAVEDIGAGTKVTAQLQMGINTLNGSYENGSLFGSTATLGMSNASWGSFRVGNFGVSEILDDSVWVDPQYFQFYGLTTLVRGRDFTQAGNGLEYVSPNVHGLTMKGQYDLTNSPTWNAGDPGSGPGQLFGAQGRSDGLEVQYDAKTLLLEAIYDETRDPNGEFNNVYVSSRSVLLGAMYDTGSVKIFGGWQHLSAPDASNAGYFGTSAPTTLPVGAGLPTAVDQEWLGAIWTPIPVIELTAAVYHSNTNNGNGDATMFTVSGRYHLSERTFFYSEIASIKNSATSNFGLGDGYTDPYGANANEDPENGGTRTDPDYGHGQVGVYAGIMHNF